MKFVISALVAFTVLVIGVEFGSAQEYQVPKSSVLQGLEDEATAREQDNSNVAGSVSSDSSIQDPNAVNLDESLGYEVEGLGSLPAEYANEFRSCKKHHGLTLDEIGESLTGQWTVLYTPGSYVVFGLPKSQSIFSHGLPDQINVAMQRSSLFLTQSSGGNGERIPLHWAQSTDAGFNLTATFEGLFEPSYSDFVAEFGYRDKDIKGTFFDNNRRNAVSEAIKLFGGLRTTMHNDVPVCSYALSGVVLTGSTALDRAPTITFKLNFFLVPIGPSRMLGVLEVLGTASGNPFTAARGMLWSKTSLN